MATLMAVALGGALGSLARHWLTLYCETMLGGDFPYGIFVANIVGSFAMGIAFVFLFEKSLLSELWRSLLMVGFLGGFTTFSTFSLHSIGMLQAGRFMEAALYIGGSVILSILGIAIGISLTRQLAS